MANRIGDNRHGSPRSCPDRCGGNRRTPWYLPQCDQDRHEAIAGQTHFSHASASWVLHLSLPTVCSASEIPLMLPKPVQSGVPSAWQFGLPAMFALTAGVALALGLIRLDVNWGTLAAVFLVGSGWAYLTQRPDIAAWPTTSQPSPWDGGLSPLVASDLAGNPFGVDFGLRFYSPDHWPNWIPTVAMSATCWLTAHILQKPICRRNSRVFGRFLGVATRACFLDASCSC